MSNASEVLLDVTQLAWGHAANTMLGHGLSFRLRANDTVAILGANGAGKSTLLRTLCGQLAPLAGKILLAGKALSTLDRAQIARQVSLLVQSPIIDGELTTRELVSLGRTVHLSWWGRLTPSDQQAIDEALHWCELDALADVPLAKLSGGERQRACLAMTVAQSTPLLLLDEPTTHLDLRHTHAFFELLARLRRELGLAVLMVLHDPALAFRQADRVLVLASQGATWLNTNSEGRHEALAAAFGVPLHFIASLDPP